MISLIEALNFRCLRYVRQSLAPFEVLLGPNASGKTTFLDVIAFLSDMVSGDLETAVAKRTQNFADLIWGRKGVGFQLAVEVRIPDERRKLLAEEYQRFTTVRYEVEIVSDPRTGETIIATEQGTLIKELPRTPPQRSLFPCSEAPPESVITPRRASGSKMLFSKIPGGNDNFYAEAFAKEGRWAPSFRLGPRKSTLGNLPEDESKFPVST